MLRRLIRAIFSGLFVPTKSPHNPKNTIPTIKDLQELSPEAFEHWVADIFRARGYEAVIQGTHGTGLDVSSRAQRFCVSEVWQCSDIANAA